MTFRNIGTRILLKAIRTFRVALSERCFVKTLYFLYMGKRLNLKDPKTMNEKLQWLKLYNRKPEYTQMVDKFQAKQYFAKLIGEEYIIPTLGVWDDFDDIDFNTLPDKFVLKTTHGGGNTGVVICKNKATFDIRAAKEKLNQSLKADIYKAYGEWPYKDVHKRIIAEELLGDGDNDIVDYKFYCFDGFVDSVLLCVDRQIGASKFYFFDKEWKLRRYNQRGKDAPADFTIPKPQNMDVMFELASIISKGIPYLRVDLYNVDGKIYFGESTFFPASGFDSNRLPEADLYFGSLINLPDQQ